MPFTNLQAAIVIHS